MGEQKDWDYLKILSKNDIISFLKQERCFYAPTERNVKYFKWDITAKKLQKEMEDNINVDSNSWAKKADELAVEFNNSNKEKDGLKILKRREHYIKKIQLNQQEFSKINSLMEKNNKLLDSC